MARGANNRPLRLPLFDRLLQGDNVETDRNPERALRELRESLLRDFEILFNTRPRHLPLDPALVELQKSVLSFGMPGLQVEKLASETQQEEFRERLLAVVQRFEPRFRELEVELVPGDGALDRTLRFRLRAVLVLDTVRQEVVYDALLDPAVGGLRVVDGGSHFRRP